MAKKQKQPTKTCADCIHESSCRMWTDGRQISDTSASQCPNHETVKESGAYLCGVLDERNRKKTNADRIRAMSDEELAKIIVDNHPMQAWNKEVRHIFFDGPRITHQEAWLQWLKQPAK